MTFLTECLVSREGREGHLGAHLGAQGVLAVLGSLERETGNEGWWAGSEATGAQRQCSRVPVWQGRVDTVSRGPQAPAGRGDAVEMGLTFGSWFTSRPRSPRGTRFSFLAQRPGANDLEGRVDSDIGCSGHSHHQKHNLSTPNTPEFSLPAKEEF